MKKYNNPVKIMYTNDWKLELKKTIKSLKVSNPMIVTSEGNRKRNNLDFIFNSNFIFSDIKSNPTFDDCSKIIKFCIDKKFDSVVALGGGSVMDLSKVAIAYLSLKKTNIIDLINYKKKYINNIPSIFLPTTHGTASEVTMWGTLWDMIDKKKYSISHPSLYPTFAIIDPNLTLSLPLDLSITTTMDALSHSFESIWNKNKNSISTEYAISAISLILNNVKNLQSNLESLDTRRNLLKASNLAGLAFSNTMTAAAHSISYPLTIRYDVPHGIASSITLIPLLKINKNFISEPLNLICKKNNLSFEELIKVMQSIPKGTISYKLKDWGVRASDLSSLTNQSFTKGRIDNNIIDLNSDDIFKILKSIF
jgi:alcohol dehydrogenase class IV